MGIAQRIHDTIEDWRKEWGDTLKGWMASWVEWGITKLMESLEPEAIDIIRPVLTPIVEHPDTPQYIKDMIDKLLAGKKPLPLLLLIPIAVLLFIPTITSIFQPLGSLFKYQQERLLKSFRLDPYSIITAWRRNPTLYAALFDDLKDQGWNDDRIEALKFLTLFIPTAQDQINWLAKEVFEPEMIDRYGLKDELPKYEETDFAKIGVDPTQMANYWMAHWEHASFSQVIEMLHRGVLSLGKEMPAPPTTKEGWATRDAEGEKALYDWYRLVEIPPFWRDRLTAMSWNVPTRVDVRRWWDMRTISEEELRNIYHRQGYHGIDLDNYLKWTKVYTDFAMMMTRFKNGWITEDDIRDWLKELEIPEDRIQQFIEEKIKPEKPARTAAERDLTRADFIKGIKKGVITVEEGKELIMNMGYDAEETDFIIAVHVETEGGSPANFAEYKRLAQLWRYSQGLPTERKPEEIKAAEIKLAEEYPRKRKLTEEELKVKVDTIRRSRRNRQLTRDQEIAGLLALDLTVELATAYADNDDLRLHPEKEGK